MDSATMEAADLESPRDDRIVLDVAPMEAPAEIGRIGMIMYVLAYRASSYWFCSWLYTTSPKNGRKDPITVWKESIRWKSLVGALETDISSLLEDNMIGESKQCSFELQGLSTLLSSIEVEA
jgi:hypothetical protein